jgi:hypothetical protein
MLCKLFPALILIGTLFFAPASFSQSAVTEANWQNHPGIVAVRSIVLKVDALLNKGSLVHKRGEVEYAPGKDGTREAFIDRSGIVRKFIRKAGSDDSATTSSYYYDQDGRLRFVYIEGGAVNGTHIQHRIYLDKKGNRIWEVRKLIEGPGYTFPQEWPIEEMMFNPAKISLKNW